MNLRNEKQNVCRNIAYNCEYKMACISCNLLTLKIVFNEQKEILPEEMLLKMSKNVFIG